MKTCPACGTQYEDHVPQCFVDGTSLDDVLAEGAEPDVRSATPAPAASTTVQEPGLDKRLMVGLLIAVVLLGSAVLVGVMLMMSGPPQETAAPTPRVVVEPAQAAPTEPAPPPSLKIGVTSSPDHAVVWEAGTQLCTTPCTIDHPAHAPLPRNVVLKLSGYRDQAYAIDDAALPHHVTLQRVKRAAAPPRPRPAPVTPRPKPTPKPGKPVPSLKMER